MEASSERVVDGLLREDARRDPAFATARRAAVLAYVETASRWSIPCDADTIRWALRACRIYEDLRGGLRDPHEAAKAFAFPYATTLGAYERARAFT